MLIVTARIKVDKNAIFSDFYKQVNKEKQYESKEID